MLIDLLRGSRTAAERLDSLSRLPLICAVSIEELWRGVRPKEQTPTATLIAGLRLAPLGRAEGERAGRWRGAYAARGTTLGQADCLIAAAAIGAGARLATGNPTDFPMKELDVEHWPAGS